MLSTATARCDSACATASVCASTKSFTHLTTVDCSNIDTGPVCSGGCLVKNLCYPCTTIVALPLSTTQVLPVIERSVCPRFPRFPNMAPRS
jgi:hypothetical protein